MDGENREAQRAKLQVQPHRAKPSATNTQSAGRSLKEFSGLPSLPIPLISLILPATRGSEDYARLS